MLNYELNMKLSNLGSGHILSSWRFHILACIQGVPIIKKRKRNILPKIFALRFLLLWRLYQQNLGSGQILLSWPSVCMGHKSHQGYN